MSEAKIKKIITVTICGLAFIQMLLIFWCNLGKYEEVIDFDSSLAIRHCVEMWKNQNIFLDGFNYFSTLEIDNTAFFAIPFFFLFNHLGLGLAVCHTLLYLVFLLVCCDIFSNLGCSKICGVLSTVLVFTPYAHGQLDWANMIDITMNEFNENLTEL